MDSHASRLRSLKRLRTRCGSQDTAFILNDVDPDGNVGMLPTKYLRSYLRGARKSGRKPAAVIRQNAVLSPPSRVNRGRCEARPSSRRSTRRASSTSSQSRGDPDLGDEPPGHRHAGHGRWSA